MDLIATLSDQLGLPESASKAIAGKVLGGVKSQVADKFGADDAAKLDTAVPELTDWQGAAKAAEPAAESGGLGGLLGAATSGGGLGGMLGAAAGALGGADVAEMAGVVGLLQKFGVDSSKAAMVAPVAVKFLKERLGEDLMGKVMSAAPLLAAVKDEDGDGLDMGDAMSALGGLLGR